MRRKRFEQEHLRSMTLRYLFKQRDHRSLPDVSRRNDRNEKVRKAEMRCVQRLVGDRLVRAEFAIDGGPVEIIRLDGLRSTVGFNSRKEEIPTPAPTGTLDPERLGIGADVHGALLALERKRNRDLRRLRQAARPLGYLPARQNFLPADQPCVASVPGTELERGHNSAGHQFVCKIAVVGLRVMRKSTLAQNLDPLVV